MDQEAQSYYIMSVKKTETKAKTHPKGGFCIYKNAHSRAPPRIQEKERAIELNFPSSGIKVDFNTN